MSLREKTISGAKWSAIATVIIIGLGLVQMTVLARIIDNHQFGLLTVSLVIIALADTLSCTMVSLTRLFSEKKSATLNSPRCTG